MPTCHDSAFNRPLIISQFFHSIRSHLKEHFDAQQLLDLSVGGESVYYPAAPLGPWPRVSYGVTFCGS